MECFCVPNADLGCELPWLTDVDWNVTSIVDLEQPVSNEETTALTYALCKLGQLIGWQKGIVPG